MKLPEKFFTIYDEELNASSFPQFYDALIEFATGGPNRVFVTYLSVDKNKLETHREVTDDFLDYALENTNDIDELPVWIKDERAEEIATMKEQEQADYDHAISCSVPSL